MAPLELRQHFQSPWADATCGRVSRRDPRPDIPAAGANVDIRRQENLRQLLQHSSPAPATPDAQKRFRKDGIEVGEGRRRLWDDAQSAEKQRFGAPSGRSAPVEEVMKVSYRNGYLTEALSERQEAIYESKKREPLGKGFVRGHEVPAKLGDEGFRFGRSTGTPHQMLDQSGKDVIEPGIVAEDQLVHEQYVRSHQSFKAGEQLKRRYAWPEKIHADHFFGFSSTVAAKDGAGVKQALGGQDLDSIEADPFRTRIQQSSEQDLRAAFSSPLGKRRPSRWATPAVGLDDFAFGMPTRSPATAQKLIWGSYSEEEQRPDRDLGRCMLQGRRNMTTETRAFGKSSLSKPQRFHEDARVGDVVNPERFADQAENFEKPRKCAEARALFESAGYHVEEEEFEDAWKIAAGKAGLFELDSGAVDLPLKALAKAFAERRAHAASCPDLRAPLRRHL